MTTVLITLSDPEVMGLGSLSSYIILKIKFNQGKDLAQTLKSTEILEMKRLIWGLLLCEF